MSEDNTCIAEPKLKRLKRLWNRSKAVSDTETKNRVQFFHMKTTHYSKKYDKLHSAKNNIALFSDLFIFSQTREGDLEHYFSHKNQAYPPYVSEHESLWPVKRMSSIIGWILP